MNPSVYNPSPPSHRPTVPPSTVPPSTVAPSTDAPSTDAPTHRRTAWYCVRSKPKHEHIAAANLRRLGGIAVFNPRLRVRKATRRGPVWFTEPLFPGYLFARFDLPDLLDHVRYAFGVADLVRFGSRRPIVPDQVISDLQASFGETEIHEMPQAFQPGDEVRIADGPFMGLAAIVRRYAPAAQRVQVLLEFLGRATAVELDVRSVAGETRYPEQLVAA